MKNSVLSIVVILVVSLFVVSGCDLIRLPEGPAGPQGPAGADGRVGADGADGVPSSEAVAAMDQRLQEYFDALNAFVAYPDGGLLPAGIEVFGDLFEYSMFSNEEYWGDGLAEHTVATGTDGLYERLAHYYYEPRNYDYSTDGYAMLEYDLVSFWISDGPSQSGYQAYAASAANQWIWVTAMVKMSDFAYEALTESWEYLTFAFSVDAEGTPYLRWIPIYTRYSPYFEPQVM